MQNYLIEGDSQEAVEWLWEAVPESHKQPSEGALFDDFTDYENTNYLQVPVQRDSDKDLKLAMTSIVNMLPALVQAVAAGEARGSDSDNVETTDQLLSLFWDAKPDEQSDEFWGAIVSTLATIVPTIIPVIRNLLKRPRKARGAATPPQTARSVPNTSRGEDTDLFDDYEQTSEEHQDEIAVSAVASTLAPLLIQALPAMIPLFTQLIQSGVPAISKLVWNASPTTGTANTSTASQPLPTAAPTAAANSRTGPVRREAFVDVQSSELDEYEGDPIFL